MGQGLIDELRWRGVIYQLTDDELGKLVDEESITLYAGFDPTASSLTTGHLLQMVTLARFQRAGHRPIAVAGGGTGLVGDPSFRDAERQLLPVEEIEANVEAIRAQLGAFLDLGGEQGLLVNNADWLSELRLTSFLRDVGKHFSVNMMIARESVKTRLTEREQGISFTEFTYMLLQAYDFLHLFDTYGCRLQIGGSDQWGNITAGIDLIRKVRRESTYGMTTPLIELAGKIMSKSQGNAVWLDPVKDSPYRFYQWWLNTPDQDVGRMLRLYSFKQPEQIEELEKQTSEAPAQRRAQRDLAFEMTEMVHGLSEAEGAKRASEALFGGMVAQLDERSMLAVLEDAPSSTRPRTELGSLALVDAMVAAGLATSRSDARNHIASGGAYVNDSRREDGESVIERGDLIHDRYVILRRGKKSYHLLRFE